MGIRAVYDQQQLRRVLDEQYDVVSRGQLLACGMTRSAIQHRVGQGGRWRIILPGVYAASDRVSAQQREVAALLYSGPEGVITGPVAARRFGLVASGPDYIDVLVPIHVRRQSLRFVRMTRTTRMPGQVFRSGPIRIVTAARAVADSVRGYRDLNEARSLLCAAIQRRQCSLGELGAELADGPRRGSAILLRGLNDAAAGIWSAAEGELKQLIERSDLPEPEHNVALYAEDGTSLGIVDAWWQRAGVAAEVDSREFHFSPEDWRATMARHNHITKYGVQLLHFAPAQIRSAGAAVLADLRVAIRVGLAAPPLQIRGVPRGERRV